MTLEQQLKKFLIPRLRRMSIQWPARTEALRKARVQRGLYECNLCKGHFKKEEVQVDHIIPILNIYGFQNWDMLVQSLFVPEHMLQVICKVCHLTKSNAEKELSKIKRKKK